MRALSSKPSVLVAMSGGVDSSVAAAILCQQGYRVIGITMKVWAGPLSYSSGRHSCYSPGIGADIEDARNVAEQLHIPFHLFDLSNEFRTEILDYLGAAYRSGLTPNPCSLCNPRIKFGALLKKAAASGLEFDYFATGHYARVVSGPENHRVLLEKAVDKVKDQSYFLALLSPDQLVRTLFPLGHYTKSRVRDIAAGLALPVSAKRDSQDFLAGNYASLLGPQVPGPVIDTHGNEIGRHRGIGCHTIGQRRGLGIASGKPLYVKELDLARNAVVVGTREEIFSDHCIAAHLNWLTVDSIERPTELNVKIRSRHPETAALLTPVGSNKVSVKFKEPQLAVAPGQTIVFYDHDAVVGGGIIMKE